MDENFEMPPVGGMNDDDMDFGDDDMDFGDDDMDFGDAASFLKVGEEKEIQGLKKKLVKEGEGYETPENGDEVEVYYTGTSLDGTEIHCSRDSGKPFKFTIGRGQVIKGWEISMKTMKKGENAVFTIPSELVYGESSALPKIPRNATFQLDVELLTWVSVKDICKDVTKKILAVGEKWENPKDLDEVLVKYEAKLEYGTVVGKSDGVEFRVKDGHFCPALAKAVKTMKKGEKVLLTVKPQYGFGEKGKLASAAEGAVPPSATLVINLELVSWKTVSEVTDDNKVMKKILKEGEGYERPNKGSVVKVKLLGKLQDGTIFLKKGHGERKGPFQFKTDEEQVIDGLDRAVMKMKKGELALVTIEPEYAFGSTGSLQELAVVPPNSTVNYEVDLVTFEKERELWDMNTKEKIEAAGKKKEEGNAKFKAGKYALASQRYEKAVKFIEYETSFSEEEKKQAKALKVACNLKDVACKLKLKDYKQAEKLCKKVLELESTNVKAFFVLVKAIPAMSMDEDFEMPPVGGMNDDDTDFGDSAWFLKVGEEKKIQQGLKKKLVKEGEGYETPENGDEVEVHYTETLLDGTTTISCSRDSGKPFKFTIGRGQVIKGWDIGIKTMKKGENALFTIPSKLAYGESDSLQLDVELLTWVKDICKDGSVIKKILAVGEKWENPKDLDEVLVKYEAKLEDGTVVGKSDGVEFRVNDGHFCPALAKAVKTMKKGEKVFLTVKPQYGFGQKGKPASAAEGAVPPSATLVINLELVSWKTVSEVTDDNKVMKKILKEGEGYERPNEGSVVKVKLIGKLQDGTVFLKKGHGENEEPFVFKTDEEQVIDGLDKAVMKMKKGEVALVTIEPEYAFGSTESQQELAVVPPNSTVNYEVDLVTFDKERELWDMNTKEKIEAAGKKKEEGNAKFKAGKYALASKRYEKAVKFIEYDTSFSEEEKKQAKALKVACNLNDAACKLKLKDYKQAEKLCTKVLELESTNVKALFVLLQAIPAMSSEVELEREVQLYIAQDSNQKFNALLEKIWKRIPKSPYDTVPDSLKFLRPYHAFFKNTLEQMDDWKHYLSDIMSVLDLGEMEYLDQVDFPKIGTRPITELTLNELKLEVSNRSLGLGGKQAMLIRLAYSIRMEEDGYFKKVGGIPIFKLGTIDLQKQLRLRLLRSSGPNREELAMRLAKAVNSDIKISEDENSLEKSLDPVQIDHLRAQMDDLRAHLSDSLQVVFLDLEFKHHTILEVGIVLVDLVTWKMKEFQVILRQTKEFMKSYVGRTSLPRTELEADSSPRFSDISQTIFDCLHKRVVVGHNIRTCDITVLRDRFYDLGLDVPEPRLVIDTLEWINQNNLEDLYPYQKLEDLAGKFNLCGQTHRALEDCYLNIEVFKILLASKRLREMVLDESTNTETRKRRKSSRSKSSR